MISPAPCILYTQDQDLVRRTRAFLSRLTRVRHVQERERLAPVLTQNSPALLLVDLRGSDSRDLLEQVQTEWTDVLIVALGTSRSEPLREAEQAGIYAAEDLQLDRRHLQALVSRAFDYLRLLEENRALREQSPAPVPREKSIAATADDEAAALRLLRFPRVFRRFQNVDALLDSVIERLADAAMVARVGIFLRDREGDRYRLRAGLRCLPETASLEYNTADSFVRWLELRGHLVARRRISEIEAAQRHVLRRAFDSLGAEVIAPLHSGARIIGWIFFGHRLAGESFDEANLAGLMALAEHVSTVLENASLDEEATRQRTLAETLLSTIPAGIVATDEDAVVRWVNPTGEAILGIESADVLNKPVETAGRRVAATMRDALENNTHPAAQRWVDPKTRRSFSIQARRLRHDRTPLGAVAIIQDKTPEEALRQKQELTDRAAFWSDLAESMSHEIRNPLVAIKTFAQLLPERFDDPDFRREFNQIVVEEIERLDRIITQINNFAHPAELNFQSVDLRSPLRHAVELVRSHSAQNGLSVETTLPDDLPKVLGDENALAEVFTHLMTNAAEATSGQSKAKITISARPIREGEHTSGVVVTVQDNGKGISAELKDKIFSPFCTTKARGMGLGLPIVKRTVFDHHGRVDVDSNPNGTAVNVMLPALENGA